MTVKNLTIFLISFFFSLGLTIQSSQYSAKDEIALKYESKSIQVRNRIPASECEGIAPLCRTAKAGRIVVGATWRALKFTGRVVTYPVRWSVRKIRGRNQNNRELSLNAEQEDIEVEANEGQEVDDEEEVFMGAALVSDVDIVDLNEGDTCLVGQVPSKVGLDCYEITLDGETQIIALVSPGETCGDIRDDLESHPLFECNPESDSIEFRALQYGVSNCNPIYKGLLLAEIGASCEEGIIVQASDSTCEDGSCTSVVTAPTTCEGENCDVLHEEYVEAEQNEIDDDLQIDNNASGIEDREDAFALVAPMVVSGPAVVSGAVNDNVSELSIEEAPEVAQEDEEPVLAQENCNDQTDVAEEVTKKVSQMYSNQDLANIMISMQETMNKTLENQSQMLNLVQEQMNLYQQINIRDSLITMPAQPHVFNPTTAYQGAMLNSINDQSFHERMMDHMRLRFDMMSTVNQIRYESFDARMRAIEHRNLYSPILQRGPAFQNYNVISPFSGTADSAGAATNGIKPVPRSLNAHEILHSNPSHGYGHSPYGLNLMPRFYPGIVNPAD